MNRFVIIKLISTIISSLSQILLKTSADKTYDSKIKEYLNPHVIISYAIFVGSAVLATYAMKGITLSLSSIIESLNYILVPIFGYIFLKEKLSKRQLLGIIILFIGFIIYSL